VESMRAREATGRGARVAVIVALVLVVVIGVVLVVTQIDKWTCSPPAGVWVESADECVELP
jgi:hypothetical protein